MAKYTTLASAWNDSLYLNKNSELSAKNEALYSYNSYKRSAAKSMHENQTTKFSYRIVLVLIVILILLGIFFIRKKTQKVWWRHNQLLTKMKKYRDESKSIADNKILENTKLDRDNWKEELELTIHLAIEDRDILKHFDELLIPQNVQLHPNQNDWTNIIILMKKYKPKTYDFLTTTMSLSAQELKVCILVVFGYTSGDIAILLQTTSQRVSNIKSTLGIKLFNTSGARSFTNKFPKSLIINRKNI